MVRPVAKPTKKAELCGRLSTGCSKISFNQLGNAAAAATPIGVKCEAKRAVMNARDLDRYKRILLEKQQEFSAAGTEAETLVPAAGGPQGDVIDQANADSEAELKIRLRRTDGRLLRAIEEALTRIRSGTFGACEACGQRISKARLEAVPWTRLCRDCKERQSA